MWCIACKQYPQLGHSVPFVQGTSNFMLCTLKHHQRSGSHAVSLALWQSGGRVTSVIKTLPQGWVLRQQLVEVAQVHDLLAVTVSPYHKHWASVATLDHKVPHLKCGISGVFF